ncbi:hypothetical protein N0V94_001101 [Neodidymelliopsis sp. IMI 364377]|nr:hypothetical protein N0V94_001101 [Neodidymelliopsis sp. IMI 364377]
MQRAFDRDPANHNALQNANPTPMDKQIPATPALTPLPGTNLTLDDFSPEIAPLPPSMNPSSVHNGNEDRGYFDIPIEAQHGANSSHGVNPDHKSTDVMNDPAYTQPVAQHYNTGGQRIKVSNDTNAHGILVDHDISERTRREHKNLKLQGTVCTQMVHRDAQTLPLRSKPKVDNFGDRFRKDPVVNDHPDVNNNRLTKEVTLKSDSRHLASDQLQKGKIANKGPISITSTGSYSGNGRQNSSTAGYEYAVCDKQIESHRSAPVESIWGRHTGLYDGTGYGDDTGLFNTPAEPDESTKPMYM